MSTEMIIIGEHISTEQMTKISKSGVKILNVSCCTFEDKNAAIKLMYGMKLLGVKLDGIPLEPYHIAGFAGCGSLVEISMRNCCLNMRHSPVLEHLYTVVAGRISLENNAITGPKCVRGFNQRVFAGVKRNASQAELSTWSQLRGMCAAL